MRPGFWWGLLWESRLLTEGVELMPINSKQKGARGERMFAQVCRDEGFSGSRRTAQFCGNTGDASDVVGLPGIHIECKYTEKLNLRDAMEQAIRDAAAGGKGNLPIVAHKKNHCPWLVTMKAEDWFQIYREWVNGEEG
jgi:Holliday junction resolvase